MADRYGDESRGLRYRFGCGCQSAATHEVCRRVSEAVSRRSFAQDLDAAFGAGNRSSTDPADAALARNAARRIVLSGARIFDGVSGKLIEGTDVIVAGNLIEDLLPAGQGGGDARVIDCAGHVIMPGLIDAHWHSILAAVPLDVAMTADITYVYLLAAQEAERTILRGFTTVRDVGGPSFALKRAIDEHRIAGPRIFPSGAMISQTSGHGDFRSRRELPRTALCSLSAAEAAGISSIADGVPEILKRVREQLMLGASQIKIMAGGGVSSMFDPLDSIQYTEEEMRAAVTAASDWGTYVCAHVYTSAGIRRALSCGVRSIEHGQLADEETARRMADAGAWWSLQPFLADEDANPKATEAQRLQQKAIAEGTVRAFELGQKHDVKMAWGTDVLFNPAGASTQGRQLSKLARWFENVDVLRLGTSRNAELLGLSGSRNPYPGELGVIRPGAFADLLVVEGNPLDDVALIADPQKNMRIIMKDGRIYKNTLGVQFQ
ncbi:metal-dependent hydrolase family protein [Paraburkholderia lycopersici]|uniref:Imidazolonepropionase n=1 Tax=Paraburkholderia lycopersici TaxID=416944 RepID=A0A1G6RAR9_9BURK|nr:amidohydrolase family protein [Paraburkholderia lycopersici]SDD01720.1 Imidazolonepropionase [Paraburkholderia lycopersici]